MITVFYDGKCGLCRREIAYYKRIAPEGILLWQDITVDASMLENLGIAYKDGLKLLHAQDIQGKMHVGVDAFLLIWRHIPRWRILGKIVAIPFVYLFAKAFYQLFARWRFKRLAHCQLATQEYILNKPEKGISGIDNA
jgi:predicted DCC family thiol-disulfide oxidoreductase YuxK